MASYIILPPNSQGFGAGLGEGMAQGGSDIAKNFSQYAMMKKFFPNGLYGNRYAQNPNYSKTVADVMAGLTDPSALSAATNQSITQDQNTANPGQDDMTDAAQNNPADENMEVTDATGEPADANSYQRFAQQDLINKLAPGMTTQQVAAKVLGLTNKQPSTADQFNSDVQNVVAGKGTWDGLVKSYPSKVEGIMKIKNGLDIAADQDGDTTAQGAASAQAASQYKPGDTRTIGSTTYVRDQNGLWQPQAS